ncbi:MAG: hypothetical protein CMF62_00465 [Magnetococcales bacterium]|nr:hypothetical protein [Magnetococcales bacterium]|tara:strand:+ start:7333 stop:8403 length:1071 start_codon:yes stop_codon:yes gene_type:complete
MEMKINNISPKKRYYKFNLKIGHGAFKNVYHGYDSQLGKYVAWNEINLNSMSDKDMKTIQNEISLLINIKKKNSRVLNFYCSWYDKENNNVVFITDIYLSGNLREFIDTVKVITIGTIKRWSTQILDGMSYLHSSNIIHRDLKCSNIFINGMTSNIVIGDFGIARTLKNGHCASTIVGTPEYLAPEVYEGKYEKACDIYAFGMCLLEMATNEVPFLEFLLPAQIWKNVINGKRPKSLDKVKNKRLLNLITYCTNFTPESRPTINQILKHEFFQKNDEDEYIISFLDKNNNNNIEQKETREDIVKAFNSNDENKDSSSESTFESINSPNSDDNNDIVESDIFIAIDKNGVVNIQRNK